MLTLEQRVYYEDTDAGGVVYHSQYLNFMERARTEWLRSLGFSQRVLREDLQVLFVVHRIEIAYKKPARLDDVLQIQTEITKIGHGSMKCQQVIRRGDTLLIDATVNIACVHAETFKPIGIPPRIKLALERS